MAEASSTQKGDDAYRDSHDDGDADGLSSAPPWDKQVYLSHYVTGFVVSIGGHRRTSQITGPPSPTGRKVEQC